MIDTDSIIELGFYGKLPTYGDFIQKRLPKDFLNPWHEWLQTGMLACRERDPEGWLSYYLNCPPWNFVLSGGICGEQTVAGVTIPSVDRVGRYFNFTMASILPTNTVPAVFAAERSDWLESVENLAVTILEEEMDQEGIEATINERSAELIWEAGPGSAFEDSADHVKVSANGPSDLSEMLPQMLHNLIVRDTMSYGLWWHQGSSQGSAQLVSCNGMPGENLYLSLMMDVELVPDLEDGTQAPEVDYMDELLSD